MLILCFDTETTGLSTEKDRIIEMSVVIKDLETWSEKIRYVRRFNPEMHIASRASDVHGILDADVINQPLFSTAAPLIAAMIAKSRVIVGHNIASFDIPLLVAELARCGVSMPSNNPQIVDTTQARWATPDGKIPTLGELCYSLDVPYDKLQAHGADYDVAVNLDCFKRGYDLGYFSLENQDA